MTAQVLLWVYIALLMAGGLAGFLKAGSKASLIASSAFAVVLALFALNLLPFRFHWTILLVLLAFFSLRLMKTRRFMPAGLMIVLTLLALASALLLGQAGTPL